MEEGQGIVSSAEGQEVVEPMKAAHRLKEARSR